MARSKKKRLIEEAVVGAAVGGAPPWLLMRFMPRRWHVGTFVVLFGALLALGVVKLKWKEEGPGVGIDLERSAQIERQAERLLKAAKDSLQQNR
jgi:hypothetical protein